MSPVTHGWAAARAYCGVLFRLLQRCRDMRPGTRHFHTLESFANVPILMQMTCMGRLGHVASGVPGATPLMHGACGALDQKWRSLCKIHFAYTQYKGQTLQETVTTLQITNIMLGFRSFGPLVAMFCLLKCPKACKDFPPPPEGRGQNKPKLQSRAICWDIVRIDLGLFQHAETDQLQPCEVPRVATTVSRPRRGRRRDAPGGAYSSTHTLPVTFEAANITVVSIFGA